jgi:hypothetical protein
MLVKMGARNLTVLSCVVVLISVMLVLQPGVEGYLGQIGGGKRFINRKPMEVSDMFSEVRLRLMWR